MKKAFLTLAVVAAVALVSCNNKAKEEAADANADSAVLVEEEAGEIVTDSIVPAADSTAAAAADTTVAK